MPKRSRRSGTPPSTCWTLVTESGRITAYTYDAVDVSRPAQSRTPPQQGPALAVDLQLSHLVDTALISGATGFTYDTRGQRPRVNNALGHVTSWKYYNTANRVVSSTA